MSLTDSNSVKHEGEALLRALPSHFQSLSAAGCDHAVLEQYSRLLRLLKTSRYNFVQEIFRPRETGRRSAVRPTLVLEELRNASLDDLDRIVGNDATPRKDLEFTAVERFSVPRGSMRSFSNRKMLVDKLRVLVDNERTHEAIGEIARGRLGRSSSAY